MPVLIILTLAIKSKRPNFVHQTTIARSGWHVSVVSVSTSQLEMERRLAVKPIPIVQAVSRVLKAAEFVVELSPTASEPTEGDTCFDGQWRKCGSKIGACEYGQEYCVDGSWSGVCEGGVQPTAEVCNGIDDDCDGTIPADELDLDEDGISACEGDCDDSNSAINPGQSDICNGLDDDCDGDVDEDGVASCDDGLYCNGAETCGGGSCLSGAPIECGDSGDACQVSQCDDSIDACVNVPTVDGTVCDDGNLVPSMTVVRQEPARQVRSVTVRERVIAATMVCVRPELGSLYHAAGA